MKQSFLLYLVIFLVLTNLFTYMYFSKSKSVTSSPASDNEVVMLKRQLDSLTLAFDDADYFSLDKNQNAQDYFENEPKPLYYKDIMPVVTDRLLEFNNDPEGNPYVGQEKLGTQKFIINKVKLLNHRWIIADFSNGQLWGDTLIKYFVNEDGSVTFENLQSFIYSK